MAFKLGTVVLLALLLSLALWIFGSRALLLEPKKPSFQSSPESWRKVEPSFATNLFSSFADSDRQGRSTSQDVSVESTYRLAGTFISYDSSISGEVERKAIIDNVSANKQSLVSLGDLVDSRWTVKHIESERVELESKAGEILTLYLGLTASKTSGEPGKIQTDKPTTFAEMPALSTSDFGKQIGTNRWLLSRSAILEYYNELLEEPDRLANIFVSMGDVVENDQLIGYRVGPKGEQPFFDAFGLQSNDVVRAVNSMKMVSPRRSQYLFQEFMQDRLNTFVFDIERDGKEEKLIYLIR